MEVLKAWAVHGSDLIRTAAQKPRPGCDEVPEVSAWLAKYYPQRASLTKASEALDHSLTKWEGLQPEVLKQYHMARVDSNLRYRWYHIDGVGISGDSCALCVHHHVGANCCTNCPLQSLRGLRCDVSKPGEVSPWHSARDGNPQPMLLLLRKAKEMQSA